MVPLDAEDRNSSRKALSVLGLVVVVVIYLIMMFTLFLAGKGWWGIILTFALLAVSWGGVHGVVRRGNKPMETEQERLTAQLQSDRHDYLASLDGKQAAAGALEAEMLRRQSPSRSRSEEELTAQSDSEETDEPESDEGAPNLHEPLLERVEQGNAPDDTMTRRQYPIILADPALVFAGTLFGLVFTIISEQRDDPAQYAIPWLFVASFVLLIGIRYYEAGRNRIAAINQWRGSLSRLKFFGSALAVIFFVVALWLFFSNGHPVDLSWLGTVLSTVGGWISWVFSIVFHSTVSFMATLTLLAGVRFGVRFLDWYINPIILGPSTLTKLNGLILRGRPSIQIADISNFDPQSVEIRVPFTKGKKLVRLPWVRVTFDSSAQHEPFVPRGRRGQPGEQINVIPFVPRDLASELEARYEYLKDPRQG